MKPQEQHIYGSARLGVVKQDLDMIGAVDPSDVGEFDRVRGMKRYELMNHLGNVLTVISDRKMATVDNGVNVCYHAEIISYSDYYPFGASMSQGTTDRTWSVEEYRFGFNGKESVDEMIGESNGYDFGARMYDARVGRFLSLDPDGKKYPYWSPYLFATNNPIRFIDVNGEGPGDKVKIKDVTSAFKSTTPGSTFKVTVYVKQPGSGGDRDTWEGFPTDPDVGHTFIKLTQVNKDGSQVERIVGFYPNEPVDLDKPEGLGTFKDDDRHVYSVSKEFSVDAGKFQATLDYLNGMDGKNYNLNSQNCTDIGLGCANASGNKLPDTEGTWGGFNIMGYDIPKGGGSNPGDLG